MSPHSERFGPITAWSRAGGPSARAQRLDAGGDDDVARVRGRTRPRPASGRTRGSRWCATRRSRSSDRRPTPPPAGRSGSPRTAGSRCRRSAASFMRPVTVRAEAHRRRRIDQPHADAEGAGDRVGARRDLAHHARRGDLRIRGQRDGDVGDSRGAASLTRAGTSNTASRPPSRATWTIMRPAPTTSPGSAPLRRHHAGHARTPAACSRAGSARGVTCDCADSTCDSARLQHRLGLVERRARHRVLDHQVAHARRSCCAPRPAGRCAAGELRPRRLQAAFLVLRVEPRDRAGPAARCRRRRPSARSSGRRCGTTG